MPLDALQGEITIRQPQALARIQLVVADSGTSAGTSKSK